MKKQIPLIFLVSLFLIYSCQQAYFTSSGMAEDHFFLRSGNHHMPVTVAGNIDAGKFILIIHGGPGGNGLDYRDTYVRDRVESEFAVVYWDQRFAGNSQGNGGDSDISAFRNDIKSLLLLLKNKYGNDKSFYLFAHSWGGFLAPYFLVEENNQDLVKGWIQIGGAHNYLLNDSLTREMLIFYGNREIDAGNNVSSWTEIVEWCEENDFKGSDNALQLNIYAHQAEGLMEAVTYPESDDDFSFIRQTAFMSHWINQLVSGLIRNIDNPAYTTPISDQLHKIKLPTLLLWGRYDFVCPLGLSDDIEKYIGSSNVSSVIYENSGHSPMYNQAELFWQDVMEWVKQH